MNGVVNERTHTVHKKEAGEAAVRTVCGATFHVNQEQLHETEISSAVRESRASRCGRCFEDAGGY